MVPVGYDGRSDRGGWASGLARRASPGPATAETMSGTSTKLATAVETYFEDLRRIPASGGATGERSSYGPLANLLNAVGATLKPKVCGLPRHRSESARAHALPRGDSFGPGLGRDGP